jgi:hypothetical protein
MTTEVAMNMIEVGLAKHLTFPGNRMYCSFEGKGKTMVWRLKETGEIRHTNNTTTKTANLPSKYPDRDWIVYDR